jgi:hypothetical protein
VRAGRELLGHARKQRFGLLALEQGGTVLAPVGQQVQLVEHP